MGEVLFEYGISLLELNVGMYACFDVKIKYPWRQIAGALLCLALVEILKPMGFPVSVTASITAMIVVFFCMGKERKNSFYRVGILALLISGLRDIVVHWFCAQKNNRQKVEQHFSANSKNHADNDSCCNM